MKPLTLSIFIGLGVAMACTLWWKSERTVELQAVATGQKQRINGVEMTGNTARDGEIAVREEFDAARKLNTKEALSLFIRRHPNSRWTDAAKVRLEKLTPN